MSRPEQKTKELVGGKMVYEAYDCRFVSSPSRTVHERAPSDSDEYDYEYHPKCGQRLPDGSLWSRVDADSPEEAVMKFDLVPCTQCFNRARKLELWRKDVHSAYVIESVDAPDKWK